MGFFGYFCSLIITLVLLRYGLGILEFTLDDYDFVRATIISVEDRKGREYTLKLSYAYGDS